MFFFVNMAPMCKVSCSNDCCDRSQGGAQLQACMHASHLQHHPRTWKLPKLPAIFQCPSPPLAGRQCRVKQSSNGVHNNNQEYRCRISSDDSPLMQILVEEVASTPAVQLVHLVPNPLQVSNWRRNSQETLSQAFAVEYQSSAGLRVTSLL